MPADAVRLTTLRIPQSCHPWPNIPPHADKRTARKFLLEKCHARGQEVIACSSARRAG